MAIVIECSGDVYLLNRRKEGVRRGDGWMNKGCVGNGRKGTSTHPALMVL